MLPARKARKKTSSDVDWSSRPSSNYAIFNKNHELISTGYAEEDGAIAVNKEDYVVLKDDIGRDCDDMVNHPPHYTQGNIECIDAIKAALTPDEFRGYCKGAALKYCRRERHKGGDESLKKAVWYLNKAVEVGNE